jgi:CRP-like cAMP-binding protein
MRVIELTRGNFLYEKGDACPSFYFVLKGKLELVVKEAQ